MSKRKSEHDAKRARVETMPSRHNDASFLVNSILYAPPIKILYDSSDEENDSTFTEEEFDHPPYTTTPSTKNKIYKYKITEKSKCHVLAPRPSAVVGHLLEQLSNEAFEEVDKNKLSTNIAGSFCVNRMKSLSDRKNNSLQLELNSQVASNIKHEVFGCFWETEWYKNKKKVEYQEVKKYYKQLKRHDKEHGTEKAKTFLENNEKDIPVPYRELRDFTKDHPATKALVKWLRGESVNSPIYLSLIDGDTQNFNHIYSEYINLVVSYYLPTTPPPTIMTTGYAFSYDANYRHIYEFISLLDRKIRAFTNAAVSGGTYFPEPNLCILIPNNCDTVPEAFISSDKKSHNNESAVLIRNINSARQNVTYVFDDTRNPLITTIPTRMKQVKNSKKESKKTLSFSPSFTSDNPPEDRDIEWFKQVGQANFHENVWYKNLLLHTQYAGNSECISLLSTLRKHHKENVEYQKALEDLEYLINDTSIIDGIENAMQKFREFTKRHGIKEKYVSQEQLARLNQFFSQEAIEGSGFTPHVKLLLAQNKIAKLIQDHKIDLKYLKEILDKGLSPITLETILQDNGVLCQLKSDSLKFKDITNLAYLKQQQNVKGIKAFLKKFIGDTEILSCLLAFYKFLKVKEKGEDIDFDLESTIHDLQICNNENWEDLLSFLNDDYTANYREFANTLSDMIGDEEAASYEENLMALNYYDRAAIFDCAQQSEGCLNATRKQLSPEKKKIFNRNIVRIILKEIDDGLTPKQIIDYLNEIGNIEALDSILEDSDDEDYIVEECLQGRANIFVKLCKKYKKESKTDLSLTFLNVCQDFHKKEDEDSDSEGNDNSQNEQDNNTPPSSPIDLYGKDSSVYYTDSD